MAEHAIAAGPFGTEHHARRELPARRITISHVLEWNGCEWLLGVSYDEDGSAREVFAELVRLVDEAEVVFPIGDDLIALVHDAAIVTSHILQRGERAAELAKRLAPLPNKRRRPTIHYLLAAAAAEAETIDGDAVRLAYDCYAGRIAKEKP